MASIQIAKPGRNGSVREVTLTFESVDSKPQRVDGEWTMIPVDEEEYALYWASSRYPRKMYFTREDSEELIGIVAQELGVKVTYS